jgi:ATP-dependent Clp protease ATP-binding subunit ClpA
LTLKLKLRVRQSRNGLVFDPPGNTNCEAAAVIARAIDIAAVLNAKVVCLTHLWTALVSELSVGRSLWFGTLQSPDDRTEPQLRRQMLGRLKVPNLQRRALPKSPRLPLSDALHDLLRRAVEEARQLAHAIGSEHLLLALMHAKRAALFKDAETYSLAYVTTRQEVIALRPTRRTVASRNGKQRAPGASRVVSRPSFKPSWNSRGVLPARPIRCTCG